MNSMHRYRKLAMKWHPDKNPDSIVSIREYFINEGFILRTHLINLVPIRMKQLGVFKRSVKLTMF